MHFVLINQFYPPSSAPTGRLLHDLAMALRCRGHAVTVMTSAGAYGADDNLKTDGGLTDNVSVLLVGKAGRHSTAFGAKIKDYALFHLRVRRALARFASPPDMIVSMTTPPLCGLIASRLRGYSNVPRVLWCMDLYPEALAANGWLSARNPLYRILAWMARAERSRATRIITLGADMTLRVRESLQNCNSVAGKCVEIPVWSSLKATPAAPGAAAELRRQRGWRDNQIILMYSGNMGRAHRIEEFTLLAKALRRAHSDARLVFSGTGPMQKRWQRRGGDLFEWLAPVNDKDLTAHLLSADIHLVSQQIGWTGVVVPSKYQAACGVGRPVIFAGPPSGSVAGWIRSGDTGWILAPGDSGAVDRAVAEIGEPGKARTKGRHAARQAASLFDRDRLLEKTINLLENQQSAIRGRTFKVDE